MLIRRPATAVVALALLASLFAALLPRDAETECQEAVRALGTNAVPLLVSRLLARDCKPLDYLSAWAGWRTLFSPAKLFARSAKVRRLSLEYRSNRWLDSSTSAKTLLRSNGGRGSRCCSFAFMCTKPYKFCTYNQAFSLLEINSSTVHTWSVNLASIAQKPIKPGLDAIPDRVFFLGFDMVRFDFVGLLWTWGDSRLHTAQEAAQGAGAGWLKAFGGP